MTRCQALVFLFCICNVNRFQAGTRNPWEVSSFFRGRKQGRASFWVTPIRSQYQHVLCDWSTKVADTGSVRLQWVAVQKRLKILVLPRKHTVMYFVSFRERHRAVCTFLQQDNSSNATGILTATTSAFSRAAQPCCVGCRPRVARQQTEVFLGEPPWHVKVSEGHRR